MTESYTSPSGSAIASPVKNIAGHQICRRLSKLNATARALLAHDLERRALQVQGLTRKQASTLARVSSSYVGTLQRATDDERRALERGSLSLSALHHRRRPISDADVERFVIRSGPDRVFRILDRLTSPVAAE